jgi:L-threonylcarbamoyladenylate synthase
MEFMRIVMEIIQVITDNLEKVVEQAAAVLQSSGVVVYPTDTTYALAVHGLCMEAIEKIFQIKGRSHQNPIHLVVRDMAAVKAIAELSTEQEAVLTHWLPGPLTFVLVRKPVVPSVLVGGGSTIGVRIPNHPVTQALSRLVDFPYTTTSANRTGLPTVYAIPTLLEQMPDGGGIDLVLDYGDLTRGSVSTVVDISQWPVYKVIREGVVSTQKFAEWVVSHKAQLYERE